MTYEKEETLHRTVPLDL